MTQSRTAAIVLRAYVVVVLAFVFAPIVASVVFSFNSDRFPSLPLGRFTLDWYRAIFDDPVVIDGFQNSIVVGVVAGSIATFLGFSAAYTAYRFAFFGKRAYLALALLPPMIPPVIGGLAMLAYLSRIELSGSREAVIVSHVVLTAPFAFALVRLRLSQMDTNLEAAAWNLGGSEWHTMLTVVVRFCRPAILAAFLITMAVSFDEFTIAWFVSGTTSTEPVVILNFLQGQVSPKINAIGTLVFAVSMSLVILAQALFVRRLAGPPKTWRADD